MRTTVLTVGNALIDLFLKIHNEESVASFDGIKNTISFPAGQKILLDTCDYRIGGNACNVAVGLKRLGVQSALMAEIASDEFSEKIINELTKEGVDLSYLLRSDGQSSISVAINVEKERTLFTTHRNRGHKFSLETIDTEWIYLTSLGNEWEHVYRKVEELARSKKIRLAFNPGSVQFAAGVPSFVSLLPLTEILFVNKEEAERLVGKMENEFDYLRALLEKGVKLPVMTDGENGAYVITETGEKYHQEAIQAPVIEKTGAGDAFASGFLSAFVQGKSIKEAMKYGIVDGAAVVGAVGSQPGLLTAELMTARVL